MNMIPFTYKPETSIEVLKQTNDFLEKNIDIKESIEHLGWVCHHVGEIIPQTTENFWSGHSFPYSESWEELQISYTQCSLGLYKQAFVTLRSALELGLLSVYYNINDDGHETVSEWYRSQETSEANTPRSEKIWKILLSNCIIKQFNDKFDIKQLHLNLGYLHNYVHSKGLKYSNSLDGIAYKNSQSFEEKALKLWLTSFEKIIQLIATLHLLKYPIAVIEFDYGKKFGIDIPNFGGLEKFKIDKISSILPAGFIDEIKKIAMLDPKTQSVYEAISKLPDMTDEEIENQIIEFEKYHIENGQGFIEWEKRQLKLHEDFELSEISETMLKRIGILKKWAIENDLM